jgi:hypothetical protein
MIKLEDMSVEEFLSKCKKLIEKEEYSLVSRKENEKDPYKTLIQLGWLVEDFIQFLLGELVPGDYFRGPSDERDKNFPPGTIYEFKKKINEDNYYIKLKLKIINPRRVIIFFHLDH